jgi:hypothetical membrane protein
MMPSVHRVASSRSRNVAVCGALALTAAAILVARGGGPVTPVSDTAVIESYTLYASRAELMVGPYSRYGWHHPGPLYFYLLAPVYMLAGGSTPGLSAGALLINVASIVLLAWVLVRIAAGWLTVAIAAAMALYVWRLAPLLVSPWNPHVVVIPLAALTVVAAAVATGDHGLLPLGVGLASFVMQTHLGVAPTAIAVTAVLASATWQAARAATPTSRRAAVAAAAVAAALWAMPLAEQASASPGNMTAIWRFFSSPDRGHQTMAATYAAWSDMVTGIVRPDFHLAGGSPFRRSRWRLARTVAACEIAALLGIALVARRRRRRFEAAFVSVLLLALAVAFTAVTRIHDDIIDHDVFWISALGALVAATIAAAAVSEAWRSDAPTRLVAGAALGAAAAATFVGFGELTAVTKRTINPEPARRAAAVIGDALARHVRSTSVKPHILIDQDEWPVAAGALLHLQRSRLPFAVDDDWLVMFTEHARLTGAENARIAITGPARHYQLTSRGEGETIAAADPFYAVVLTAKPSR